MSAREFQQWQLYAELEPFGPLRDDLRAGTVAAAAVSPWVKRGQEVTAATFFPELSGRRAGPPSVQEQRDRMAAWVAAMRPPSNP